jgi:hypothetical protein
VTRQKKLESLGDRIQGLDQNNRKKHKKLNSQYKQTQQEYIVFEHQLSQAMGMKVDLDIGNGDASFLEEEEDV